MSKYNIIGVDFRDSVKYDYRYKYSCKEHGCGMICRCGMILDAVIKSIDISDITYTIYNSYFDNSKSTKRNSIINNIVFGTGKEIDIYTIDRILRHFKIWDKDNWVISINDGFYGQEIGDISIRDSVAKLIEENLNIAFTIDELNGRIEYLMGLEYGPLIQDLEGSQYEIIDVDKSDIKFSNDNHYNDVKNKNLYHYSDSEYSGIRGIVILKERKVGDQYRLIDGYHRCYASNKKSIKVLRAYKEKL